ncbi:Pycsar system effector family protein [Flavobacterium sp. '19STA2R22 D10 B1']|uniref:Pycsar system effector family protein n=1 Tax=Flavobacterium aerium TaxID=3037261 RepID=UPI00278BC769|nr:Pycsar system effector family protein [Flavobacterium sp. '19STA2R22 D10 B1']
MNITQKAEDYVFLLFKDKLSEAYTYHNFNHTLRVVQSVSELLKAEPTDEISSTLVLLAAWFHDTGYIDGCKNHEQRSAEIARTFLTEQNVAEASIQQVIDLIMVTEIHHIPETTLERIIKDADCSHFADKNYITISELLREEWNLTASKSFTDLEWATENRKVLSKYHRFYTPYAKENWQHIKEKNIALLQEKINELGNPSGGKKSKSDVNKKKLEKLERPERGIETMFRVTLNNHTRLSDIADSKANILLSVNAIIISISLSTLIPKLDSPSNAHLVIPTFTLLMFSVVCIIFAILSTKPKVTTGTFSHQEIIDRKVNLLFFGNFHKMPLEEYQWAMGELMKDRDYLYSSMIKDLYFLGLVLNRKYKLLRITYIIFMIGIIVSVFSFVWAFQSIVAN